jgi:WD40 repeat protein
MILLQGCPGSGYKYNTGSFPVNPVNFNEMNTEYDDYNISSPILGESFPLVFSSTRKSRGENYDIVYKQVSIVFSKTTGELSITENHEAYQEFANENRTLNRAVQKINTSADELGPCLIQMGLEQEHGNEYYNEFILLYSNNENGNQDIRFTHNTNSIDYEIPDSVSFLNSDADDAYPCFNCDRSAIWFCSNRDQNFDIYKAITDPGKEFLNILESGKAITIEKDTILSSAGDDKCPYITYSASTYYSEEILNNMLVFASNRDGGFGGYDLYYSKLENGKWSEPQNFGAGINSEYDEYRPIVKPQFDFINDFMLFSSNRPGGLGGFDLYYVGIEDIGYPN